MATYDMKTDYQALINAEKAKGTSANQALIDQYNAQRNSKIYDIATAENAKASATTGTTGNNYLDSLYAAQQSQALASLKSAYDKNTSTLNAQEAKIPDTYNAARNQTASTYEQNRANFNERAAASGINSGAGSQVALSMANTYAGNLNSLNKSQADALTDIEMQKANLATEYETAIQNARANNDIARAQTLYNEYVRKSEAQTTADNTAYNRAASQAEALAQFGDYSGYKALGYSDAQIAAMQNYWNSKQKTTSYSGGSYTPIIDDNNNNNNNNNMFNTQQSQLYSGALNDSAASYQVGMNRTAQGQLATIQRLYDAGQITEAQATALISKFNLG